MSVRKTARPSRTAQKAQKQSVITLRIPENVKRKLLDHCAARTKSEGIPISYNRALLDLIEAC